MEVSQHQFGIDKSGISRHLAKIFETGELDEKVVVDSIMVHVNDEVSKEGIINRLLQGKMANMCVHMDLHLQYFLMIWVTNMYLRRLD